MDNDNRLVDYIHRLSCGYTTVLYETLRKTNLLSFAHTNMHDSYVYVMPCRSNPAIYANIHDELTPQYGN
jgi:hypothetical protein